MKNISQTFKIILSVLSHYCSQNSFSNSLVNVKNSKTDTFSVVLSLQTHLLAFADWMLDFLRPFWQYMFFRKKKLSRVSRVPFIGKDFPCFVMEWVPAVPCNGSLLPKRCLAVWCSGAGSLRRLLSKREPREGVHRRSQTKAQQVLVSDVPNNV